MRHILLSTLLIAAATPAAAQSCATLGGHVECGAAPSKPAAKPPQPARAGDNVQVQGSAETTVSNRGVSTTLDSRVIDSHGVVEFGFSRSTSTSCRAGQYRKPCE